MRFDGRYIGQVVDTNDPKQELRVKIRVYGVFTDNVQDTDLPWAEYAFPPGSRENDGFVTSLETGDYVWVDFPFSGNTRRPRIVGSVHHCPDGEPDAPHEMWLGPDAVEHKRRAGEPMPAQRQYYENNVYSQDGIVSEIPRTSPDGSLIVTHRATGSAIEIAPNGDIVLHGESKVYMTADSGITILTEKNSVVIVGAISVDVLAGGSISLSAPDIYLNGNVHVNGGLSISGDAVGAGSLKITGDIESAGAITDAAGNTNHHTH
jgi:hypothetical protein